MTSSWLLLLLAWLVALTSTAAALFIGEVMGMTPCVLCWYQRICMFPLALLLAQAVLADDRRGAVYALPLAAIGGTIAGYHTLLVAGWVPKSWVPCTAGVSCADQKLEILQGVQIPWLSLAAFMVLVALLGTYLSRTPRRPSQ